MVVGVIAGGTPRAGARDGGRRGPSAEGEQAIDEPASGRERHRGRHRGEPPHAVRGRARSQARAGARRDDRVRHLHPARRVLARRRRGDLSGRRPRGGHGLDADEGRHGAEARAQHAHHRGVRAHRQGVREHDGRPDGELREARGAQPSHGDDARPGSTTTPPHARSIEAGRSVKTAIVMLEGSVLAAEAEARRRGWRRRRRFRPRQRAPAGTPVRGHMRSPHACVLACALASGALVRSPARAQRGRVLAVLAARDWSSRS